ncbi:MAG: isoprenylcysteine carboxylmethyltransferase family protein [bacterium]
MNPLQTPSGAKELPDRARVRVFPPGVPLLAVLLGGWLQRVWPLRIGPLPFVPELPTPARSGIGWGIVVASVLLIGLPAVRRMRGSGQSENPWKPTTSIVETGPYRYTRNPMYLQMLLVCLGCAIVFANPWIALLTPLAGACLEILAIRPEEAYLERKFGDEYRRYRSRVRRWI